MRASVNVTLATSVALVPTVPLIANELNTNKIAESILISLKSKKNVIILFGKP